MMAAGITAALIELRGELR